MDKSKAKKSFTTRKVWTRKKNGLYGWGVRRQKLINSSEYEKETSLVSTDASRSSIISNVSFAIDYARRTSTCQTCNQTIERGELRMMNSKKYHHPYCLIQNSSNIGLHTEVFQNVSDVHGWSDIQKEDKENTLLLLEECDVNAIKQETIDTVLEPKDTGLEHKLSAISLTDNVKEDVVSNPCGFTLEEVDENFFSAENSKHVSYCINRIFSLKKRIRSNIEKLEDIGSIESLKDKSRYIYNLKTRNNCDLVNAHNSMKASLEEMRNHAVAHSVTAIHLPLICFGLNGLSLESVKETIREVFCRENMKFIVYHIGQGKRHDKSTRELLGKNSPTDTDQTEKKIHKKVLCDNDEGSNV